MTSPNTFLMPRHRVDDDFDEEPDEDDDLDEEDEESDDDEEEDEDVETWQVFKNETLPLKVGLCLTSGAELPRLAPIFQLS